MERLSLIDLPLRQSETELGIYAPVDLCMSTEFNYLLKSDADDDGLSMI